jgi:hypothetical protein
MSRRMRWEGYVALMGGLRGAYRVLGGRPDGKRPLGKPRRRWDTNIKGNFRTLEEEEVRAGLIWLRIATDGGRL